MNPDHPAEASASNFHHEILVAQAKAMTALLPSSIALNIFVASSSVAISFFNHGHSPAMLLWLAGIFVICAARVFYFTRLNRCDDVTSRPQYVLNMLTAGAFAVGLAWGSLPLFIPDLDVTRTDSWMVLMMMGMAAGAVVKGIPYSPLALSVALPPQISIFTVLVATGNGMAMVLAANVVGLGTVLCLSSRSAQTTFINNELGKLKATDLATSLHTANEGILTSHSQLEVLANYDVLTGLANRTLFSSRLAHDVASAASAGHELALLVIDLDRFKSVNDTLGHSAGDAVLVKISQRLQSIIGSGGMIARMGGDEFAVIFTGEKAVRRARRAAAELLDRATIPVNIPGGAFTIGASVGMALFPHHATSAEDLLACADMAVYEAKEKGRRRLQEFSPQLKSQADRQRQIELDLEAAIRSGEVQAWFQPQVQLEDRRIVGFEALVRWKHPRLGAISPPEIVQAAHVMHLSDHLTAHMASAACRLLEKLPGLGLPHATVAVNVSPRELSAYSLADVLSLIVAIHKVNPALLEIEITEEAILDTTIVDGELKRLEQAGYKLAVDDFGMGHSSLAYLISLKVDRLKIDRSFVVGIDRSRHNQALISALVGIGRTLSIDIVVEGVEHETEAEVLQTLGCSIGQGYLFARPMPVEALIPWMSRQRETAEYATLA